MDRTANGKQIFIKYSKYHNSSLLLKDLHKASETENEKIVSHVNDSLTHLRKAINQKEIPENEILTK